jgi:HAMP domain-containing protein
MTRIEKLLQQAQATVKASEAYEVKRQAVKVEVDALAKAVDRMVKSLELTPEEKTLLEFPENK